MLDHGIRVPTKTSVSLFFLGIKEVATLDNNRLSGTMPTEVCANVGVALDVLTADCQGAPNRPSPPLVVCECCTGCF